MNSSSVLVARFRAPLQTWSVSQGRRRGTEAFPTKSSIVGICARSLGIDLSDREAWAKLVELRLGVRADRPGQLVTEYQSSGGGTLSGKRYFVAREDGAESIAQRWLEFLGDACFLVCLEGRRGLLDELGVALDSPARCWGLGKLACPPVRPVFLDILDCGLEEALGAYGLVDEYGNVPISVGAEWGTRGEGRGDGTLQRRFDVPVDFVERRYSSRFVRVGRVEVEEVAKTVCGSSSEEAS